MSNFLRRGAANIGPTNSSSNKAEFENSVLIEQVPRFNPLNLPANKTHENQNNGQFVSRMSSKSSVISETQEKNKPNYTEMSSMRRRQVESLQDSQTEKDERISRKREMPNRNKEDQIENLERGLLQAQEQIRSREDSLREVSDDKLPIFKSDNRLDFRDNQTEKIGTNIETQAALSFLKKVDSEWIGTLNALREESKIGLKDHGSLLDELKNTLTKISKDISTPNDKILSAVEGLQISNAASNENMFRIFENERKHLLEQLLFQQNEKQRYVDEITCLKQELRHTKDEMEIEMNKFSRQIIENEKKVVAEQVSLNLAIFYFTENLITCHKNISFYSHFCYFPRNALTEPERN